MSVMTALGRRPVRVRAELPGHVVNRLQAALWREAYDLVGRGAITVADLDLAVSSGPGLRWALLGPIATQHLSGGPGGLAHVLEHLGPPMVDWWADLRRAGAHAQSSSSSSSTGSPTSWPGSEREVLARRDRALVAPGLKERLGPSRHRTRARRRPHEGRGTRVVAAAARPHDAGQAGARAGRDAAVVRRASTRPSPGSPTGCAARGVGAG